MSAPSHPAPEPLSWMKPEVREAYRAWAGQQHGLNFMHQQAFAAGWTAALAKVSEDGGSDGKGGFY